MYPALLGKKIGMTQVYDDGGNLLPVTVVQAGPCHVLQVKTVESDGYDAVQLGFEDVKPHRATKPEIGHAAGPAEDIEVGQNITVEAFENVSYVDVIGTTKGKGFAGGMKRHNFSGQRASHGTERKHRAPGSIGGHASNPGGSGGIKKGKRMAGQLGDARCTTSNHRLVRWDKENNLLLVKGAVPGPNGGYVMIRQSKVVSKKT